MNHSCDKFLTDLKAKVVCQGPGHLNDLFYTDVTSDSRQVTAHSLFVAVKGTNFDGHDFLEAAAKVSQLLIVEEENKIPSDFNGWAFKVASTQSVFAQLCSQVYSPGAQKLKFLGVTGTNGKTSTTYMLESLLSHHGQKVGVLGTNNHRLQNTIWESQLTTPGPKVLHQRLQEMYDLGAQYVAMEVSSHALHQGRVDGLQYDVAIFTNLSLDHLDYHKTWQQYYEAKKILFTSRLKNTAISIINGDDEHGFQINPSHGVKYLFGQQKHNDFIFKIIQQDLSGSHVQFSFQNQSYSFFLPIVGVHNVYNVMGALIAAWALGYSLEKLMPATESIRGIPGRLEPVKNNKNLSVFVDYAHTPDALAKVLSLLHDVKKQLAKVPQIITVFGCGGDRDKSKRPLMMQEAQRYSDVVIVTSDNPRTENPKAILQDILQGQVPCGKQLIVHELRQEALQQAVNIAQPGDIILVAGKGHENYQIIGTEKKPFSDQAILKEALHES